VKELDRVRSSRGPRAREERLNPQVWRIGFLLQKIPKRGSRGRGWGSHRGEQRRRGTIRPEG
jgi:hypothetical protein